MRIAPAVIALEPFDLGLEPERAGGVGGDLARQEEVGLALMDEVHDARLVVADRRGPAHLGREHQPAVGDPGPLRRLAGVAWVLPVDVELGLAAEAQGEAEVRARDGVAVERDQPDGRARRLRLELGGQGGDEAGQGGDKGEQAHGHSLSAAERP